MNKGKVEVFILGVDKMISSKTSNNHLAHLSIGHSLVFVYCCQIMSGAPSKYREIFDKIQKCL